VDDRGEPVCTTYYGSIYRGVSVEGANRCVETPPDANAPANLPGGPLSEHAIAIPATMAHVYTECARIHNPIHTDAAVALSAGLSEIILHGTATLALAVSKVIAAEAANSPVRVNRIRARFGAMVTMPAQAMLRILAREPFGVFFDVINGENRTAIRDGFVGLKS
ncbi:MAG TPA: MaoC/PaaZ C-terminal domain-containing protein, partial [Candidatus Binataceae bacterium]